MADNCLEFNCVEIPDCDCSGFQNTYSGQCDSQIAVTYTLPANATVMGSSTTANGTIISTSTTQLIMSVPCTGTGVNITGTVTIRYRLPGIPEECSCTSNLSISNPVETGFECNSIIWLQ